MATVYRVRFNTEGEELVKSFLSLEQAKQIAEEENTDPNNFFEEEEQQIYFYGIWDTDYTKEEFYQDYYNSLVEEDYWDGDSSILM